MKRSPILQAFIRLLWRVGKWLLRLIARHGAKRLAAYMRVRIDVFADKRKRARTKRRRRWLDGRIHRWRYAVAFLEQNEQKITIGVIRQAEQLIASGEERIPFIADTYRKAA